MDGGSWVFNVENGDFYYQNREAIMKELRMKKQLFSDAKQEMCETSLSIFRPDKLTITSNVQFTFGSTKYGTHNANDRNI